MKKNEQKTQIILIYKDSAIIKKFFRTQSYRKNSSCLFLSKDSLLYTKIRDLLPGDVKFVDTGDLLQDIAHSYKQDYIDYVGSLSCRYKTNYWWITSVSEKNPFISTVFLKFCYLKVIERMIKPSENLIIICGSYPLMDAVRVSFGDRDDIVIDSVENHVNRFALKTGRIISGVVRKTYFVIRFILRILVARFFALRKGNRMPGGGKREIAILSWTDSRSFSDEFKYRDIYFGDLSNRIEKQLADFFFICSILPTIFYPTAIGNLLRYNDRIFLLEEFLTLRDIFYSIFLVITKIPSGENLPRLDGIALSSIIHDEMNYDKFVSSRSESAMLYYFAGRRILQKGNARTLVYTFENHMWEKMLCSGIRETNIPCRLIGYAHSVISPMYLFYSLADSERDTAPVPDTILVNGVLAKERLLQAGFDKETILISGALRYENLKGGKCHVQSDDRKKVILVIPASGLDETIELVDKVLQAFRESEGITVIIKPHPTMPADRIIPVFPSLLPHVSFSLKPVEELLKITDLVLFSESAVSIETLACHIPILHVKSDIRIDMNVLDGFDQIRSVSSPVEIKQSSLELLRDGGISDDQYDKIVRDFFAPVDDEVIKKVFV